jgi:hypothetical protein
MAIYKQDDWEMASNIMKITFIIGNPTPHTRLISTVINI